MTHQELNKKIVQACDLLETKIKQAKAAAISDKENEMYQSHVLAFINEAIDNLDNAIAGF